MEKPMTNSIQQSLERLEKLYKERKDEFRGNMMPQDMAFVKSFLKSELEKVALESRKETIEEIKVRLQNSFTVAGLPSKACSKWEIVEKEFAELAKPERKP